MCAVICVGEKVGKGLCGLDGSTPLGHGLFEGSSNAGRHVEIKYVEDYIQRWRVWQE